MKVAHLDLADFLAISELVLEQSATRLPGSRASPTGHTGPRLHEEGKQHFTEAQIMELGGMIALHHGMQVLMRTLRPALENHPGS